MFDDDSEVCECGPGYADDVSAGFEVNERGIGSAQYAPKMMLALLIYCYATGRSPSREIEQATYHDVAVRYICCGNLHPDHDTICTFRQKNQTAFKKSVLPSVGTGSGTRHVEEDRRDQY